MILLYDLAWFISSDSCWLILHENEKSYLMAPVKISLQGFRHYIFLWQMQTNIIELYFRTKSQLNWKKYNYY